MIRGNKSSIKTTNRTTTRAAPSPPARRGRLSSCMASDSTSDRSYTPESDELTHFIKFIVTQHPPSVRLASAAGTLYVKRVHATLLQNEPTWNVPLVRTTEFVKRMQTTKGAGCPSSSATRVSKTAKDNAASATSRGMARSRSLLGCALRKTNHTKRYPTSKEQNLTYDIWENIVQHSLVTTTSAGSSLSHATSTSKSFNTIPKHPSSYSNSDTVSTKSLDDSSNSESVSYSSVSQGKTLARVTIRSVGEEVVSTTLSRSSSMSALSISSSSLFSKQDVTVVVANNAGGIEQVVDEQPIVNSLPQATSTSTSSKTVAKQHYSPSSSSSNSDIGSTRSLDDSSNSESVSCCTVSRGKTSATVTIRSVGEEVVSNAPSRSYSISAASSSSSIFLQQDEAVVDTNSEGEMEPVEDEQLIVSNCVGSQEEDAVLASEEASAYMSQGNVHGKSMGYYYSYEADHLSSQQIDEVMWESDMASTLQDDEMRREDNEDNVVAEKTQALHNRLLNQLDIPSSSKSETRIFNNAPNSDTTRTNGTVSGEETVAIEITVEKGDSAAPSSSSIITEQRDDAVVIDDIVEREQMEIEVHSIVGGGNQPLSADYRGAKSEPQQPSIDPMEPSSVFHPNFLPTPTPEQPPAHGFAPRREPHYAMSYHGGYQTAVSGFYSPPPMVYSSAAPQGDGAAAPVGEASVTTLQVVAGQLMELLPPEQTDDEKNDDHVLFGTSLAWAKADSFHKDLALLSSPNTDTASSSSSWDNSSNTETCSHSTLSREEGAAVLAVQSMSENEALTAESIMAAHQEDETSGEMEQEVEVRQPLVDASEGPQEEGTTFATEEDVAYRFQGNDIGKTMKYFSGQADSLSPLQVEAGEWESAAVPFFSDEETSEDQDIIILETIVEEPSCCSSIATQRGEAVAVEEEDEVNSEQLSANTSTGGKEEATASSTKSNDWSAIFQGRAVVPRVRKPMEYISFTPSSDDLSVTTGETNVRESVVNAAGSKLVTESIITHVSNALTVMGQATEHFFFRSSPGGGNEQGNQEGGEDNEQLARTRSNQLLDLLQQPEVYDKVGAVAVASLAAVLIGCTSHGRTKK